MKKHCDSWSSCQSKQKILARTRSEERRGRTCLVSPLTQQGNFLKLLTTSTLSVAVTCSFYSILMIFSYQGLVLTPLLEMMGHSAVSGTGQDVLAGGLFEDGSRFDDGPPPSLPTSERIPESQYDDGDHFGSPPVPAPAARGSRDQPSPWRTQISGDLEGDEGATE